jgi:hypothetical protein
MKLSTAQCELWIIDPSPMSSHTAAPLTVWNGSEAGQLSMLNGSKSVHFFLVMLLPDAQLYRTSCCESLSRITERSLLVNLKQRLACKTITTMRGVSKFIFASEA